MSEGGSSQDAAELRRQRRKDKILASAGSRMRSVSGGVVLAEDQSLLSRAAPASSSPPEKPSDGVDNMANNPPGTTSHPSLSEPPPYKDNSKETSSPRTTPNIPASKHPVPLGELSSSHPSAGFTKAKAAHMEGTDKKTATMWWIRHTLLFSHCLAIIAGAIAIYLDAAPPRQVVTTMHSLASGHAVMLVTSAFMMRDPGQWVMPLVQTCFKDACVVVVVAALSWGTVLPQH